MDQITIPSGLLSCFLLIPLRGQEARQKQVVIGHRGRSAMKIFLLCMSVAFAGCFASDTKPIGVWERDLPDQHIIVSIFAKELWIDYGHIKYRFSGHWDGKRFLGRAAPENSDLISTSPDAELISIQADGSIKGNLFQNGEMRLYSRDNK